MMVRLDPVERRLFDASRAYMEKHGAEDIELAEHYYEDGSCYVRTQGTKDGRVVHNTVRKTV